MTNGIHYGIIPTIIIMNWFQKSVKNFMFKVGQPTPESPSIPDNLTRVLRVSLLLEEVLEFANASGVRINVIQSIFENDLSIENFNYEIEDDADLVEVADALADINYVAAGAGVAYGLDLEPIEKEVCRSNDSKIENGHRREDGKWIKGPNYSPADLKPIVEAQMI